jgi:hypothetical protein
MSQFDDSRLDEVRRVLRRVQDIGVGPPGTRPPAKEQQRPTSLTAALSFVRPERDDPAVSPQLPSVVEPSMQTAIAERRGSPWYTLGIVAAVAVVCVTAGVVTAYLTVASVNRQVASSAPIASPSPQPEAAPKVTAANPVVPPQVVIAVSAGPPVPSAAELAQQDRKEAAYTSVASAPRLVAPTEWLAPAGVATSLPLSVEPPEEAANHHVLVSGLEASAFVIRGTELIEGTWIVPASDLVDAKIVRKANVPGRATLTLELRTDTGAVVSRAQSYLLAPSRATGVAVK